MDYKSDPSALYNDAMAEFVKKNYEKAIILLSKVIKLAPDSKLAYISRGSAYLKLNQIDHAKDNFNRAIGIDPKYARAYHMRGLVEEKLGNDADALADFDRAIDIDPSYGAAYYSRANLHVKMGNEDLAIDDIAMVRQITNETVEIFANESNLWRSQHLKREAMMETEMRR